MAKSNAAAEWGLPNWLDARDYGDTKSWGQSRWRWEFTRRRADFREDFDKIRNYTTEHYRGVYSGEWARKAGIDPSQLLAPDDPGFAGVTTTDQVVKYGCSLFNPRISEQEMWRLSFQPNPFRGGMVKGDGEPFEERATMSIPDGAAALRIDLDRPIAPQLSGAMGYLLHLQKERHGRARQSRRHPRTWLSYLRVLDGRECGASWRQIYEAVLADKKVCNQYPIQEARRTWEGARHLMFNWPL